MADLDKKKDKDYEGETREEQKHFKLTLTHQKHKGLELAVRDIIRKLNQQKESGKIKASGPGRMPTKYLKVTTRKSPCGNGTNTFDNFEMKIHKRVFHIYSSQTLFQELLKGVYTEPGMILEADLIEADEDEE